MESDPSSLRIFVVENHLESLQAVRGYLEQMGHTVFSSETMSGALAALPGAACDVLISDLGLPDGTGWELLERLDLPAPIFAIAVSGFGSAADREKSRVAGFRRHLIKPAEPSELDALLGQARDERSKRGRGAVSP